MSNKLAASAANSLDDNAIVDSFSVGLLSGGRKPKTEETYRNALRYLARFLSEKGMPGVARLSTEHLREYFRSLYERGLQPSTVSVQYRALAAFYKWLVKEGERLDNPLERIPAPLLEEKIQPHYDADDLQAVLKRLPAVSRNLRLLRNRAVILTLFDTGLRGAELCGLRREDVNLRELTLRVEKGKGGRWREVAISAFTAQAIDRMLRHRQDLSEWLFITRDGGGFTTNGLRMMLERAWKDAGLTFRGVHAFRRGFAIAFLEAGGDSSDLQTLAGWESAAMLRRYMKATESQRARKAHARFSPVRSLNLR